MADVSPLFSLLLFEGLDTAALGATALFSFPHDGQYLNSISIREPQLEQNIAVTLTSCRMKTSARNLLYSAKFAAFAERERFSNVYVYEKNQMHMCMIKTAPWKAMSTSLLRLWKYQRKL